MSGRNIFTVYAKELRDLLRDRRTIMSMILIPTLLGPGLAVTAITLTMRLVAKARATKPIVMVVGGEHSPAFRSALVSSGKLNVVPTTPDWKERIIDKRIGAAVEIPDDFDTAMQEGRPTSVKIDNYEGEMRSSVAAGAVRDAVASYRERLVAARLSAHGLPETLVKPFDIATRNIAPPEKVGGNLFGGIIPYFFLLLSFTGAMYPALDLTAGEKERGTMETILCSPVARLDLVLGKFLMVLTASLATVACSLLSSVGTVMIAGAAHAGAASGVASRSAAGAMMAVDPLGLVAVVAMVLPMAVLFAAVQFTIALFAKSFKEAQSYVSPLIIVIILPAVIGMLPGVELNTRLALVPILNVSLVSKELVSGIWHWHYIALIFGSTCVYAAAALGLAVRMFNREDVLFRT